MLELPRHHVPRSVLHERVMDASLIVIEGASGYGKTTFATEVTDGLRVVEVAFSAFSADRQGFVRLLRRALLRSGERTAASALSDSSVTIDKLADALGDALHGAAGFTLVVEDAHHLDEDAAMLVELARRRPPAVRMVVTARVLPPAAQGLLALPGVEHVTDDELRFGFGEADVLLRQKFGVVLGDSELEQLVERTGGWPAGLALTGVHLRRRGAAPPSLESTDLRERFAEVVLGAIPTPLQAHVEQLAYLPRIDATVATAVAGYDGFLDDVLAVGLPLVRDDDGAVRIPGALADALRERAAFSSAVAQRVVPVYLEQGRPVAAIEVLRQLGDDDALARLIVDMPAGARRKLSSDEVIGVIDSLPVVVIERHPWVLIELARAATRAGVPGSQQDALDRADALGTISPAFRRAIDAERMTYELYTLYMRDREGQSRRVQELIDSCGPGEERTLGRALAVYGQQRGWEGRRGEADHLLRRAASVLTDAGEDWTAAGALIQLGFNVHLHEQLSVAEATFAEAVQLAGDDGRARATALTYLGEVKIWRGRGEEGIPDLEEAEALARATRDARAQAYAAWGLALHASTTGDVERTVARVEQAGRLLQEWMDTGVGATYVATMTDLLDRVGATEPAGRMLAEMRRRRAEAPELATIAEFGIAARRGVPDDAETLWPDVESDDGIEPFERIRCRLLRAYAALRANSPDVGARYRELIADAESLGADGVPWHLEPEAAGAVQHWWARQRGGWHIRILGDFEVRQGDHPVRLPAGKPTELVMFLSLRTQPQSIDTVIDRLWGVAADTASRARLRQLIYRLRRIVPGLIQRNDSTLGIHPDAHLDHEEFDRLAGLIRRDSTARDNANRMITLVDESFFHTVPPSTVADEFETLRSRVHDGMLAAWDTLAQSTSTAETIDYLERAHAFDPGRPERAERLAALLLEEGRTTQAQFVLDTTSDALGELGIPITPGLVALHRRLQQTP